MRSSDREKLSKKVKTTSQVFAILAFIGIIIIIAQLFSGKSGFDFFENISYSISKLFAEPSKNKTKIITYENNTLDYKNISTETEFTNTLEQSKKKAEELLKNQIDVSPIKFETPLKEIPKDNKVNPQKFSLININSILKIIAFDDVAIENIYLRNNIKIGVLPDIKSIRKSKIALGFNVSTGFSTCRIQYKNNQPMNKNIIYQTEKNRRKNNNSLLKYSFGIDMFYRINKKLTFSTGLHFTNTGESVLLREPDELSLYKNYSCASDGFFNGYPDFETPDMTNTLANVRYDNNLSYFEIPAIINFKIKTIGELTEIETQTGISLGKLYSANSVVYNFGNDAYYIFSGISPKIYNQYGINAILGLIYSKYITSNIQLFANPQCKIGLTNAFSKKYNITQHNYINSLQLGMKINL